MLMQKTRKQIRVGRRRKGLHARPHQSRAWNNFHNRESVDHLPFQWFLSWVSGCPLPAETDPAFRRPPVVHVLDSVGGFILALMLGYWSLHSAIPQTLALLPVSWVFSVGRARKMFATTLHQVAHGRLFESGPKKFRRFLDRVVGDLIGVLLFVPDSEGYHETHAKSHHSVKALATPIDKDVTEIFRFGFVPGKPVEEYWTLLWMLLVSPNFYFGYAVRRIRLSLIEGRAYRLVLSWVWLLALILWATCCNRWGTLFLVYVVPVFGGFHTAGLLQTLGRHFWGTRMELVGTRARTALVSQGRYLIDMYPGKAGPLWARVRFWVRLFGYHMLVRLTVLSGDMCLHDWHHRHPRGDFTRAAHERIRDIKAGCPGWEGLPYSHTWSLFESIDRSFHEMSAAPKLNTKWQELITQSARSAVI